MWKYVVPRVSRMSASTIGWSWNASAILRLGDVHGLADRHVLAQAALEAFGPGGREHVLLEEVEHGLGSLPLLLALGQGLLGRLPGPGRLDQGGLGLVLLPDGGGAGVLQAGVGPGLHDRHGREADDADAQRRGRRR